MSLQCPKYSRALLNKKDNVLTTGYEILSYLFTTMIQCSYFLPLSLSSALLQLGWLLVKPQTFLVQDLCTLLILKRSFPRYPQGQAPLASDL